IHLASRFVLGLHLVRNIRLGNSVGYLRRALGVIGSKTDFDDEGYADTLALNLLKEYTHRLFLKLGLRFWLLAPKAQKKIVQTPTRSNKFRVFNKIKLSNY